MRIPKEFRKKEAASSCLFSPFQVHMISLHSFTRTINDGLFLVKDYYESADLGKHISQKPVEQVIFGNTSLFVPIISLDGYNVMLIENFTSKNALALGNLKSSSNEDIYNLDKNYNYEVIHAFGLDQVKLLKLTLTGLEQYEKACLEAERFDLLTKYKTFIDEFCDGDLNTIKRK